MIQLIIIHVNDLDKFDLAIINELQRRNYKIYAICTNFSDNSETLNTFKFDKVIYKDKQISEKDLYIHYKKIICDIFIDTNCINSTAKNTLIISSEYNMLKACKDLSVNSYYINNLNELSIYQIMDTIKYYEDSNNGILKKTALKKNINIVIPMAGDGKRFLTNPRDTTPKLLRDIFDKPMISWVLNNIRIDANYIFILKESKESIRIKDILKSMIPDCKIIITTTVTQGSACSILLAENLINNSTPLLIANDNQWLDWDPEEFVLNFLVKETESKVKLSSFISNGSNRFNYIQFDNDNIVYIRHDKPISQFAITGISIWRHGEDFVRCSHKMISSNKRIKGEFCIDLVTNEFLDEVKLEKNLQNEISKKELSNQIENVAKEVEKELSNEDKKVLENYDKWVIKKECIFFIRLEGHDDVFEFEHYWKHKNSF